jgi:hypothetical protein
MGTEYEKDFDDEVYEDGFYDDNFDEEELSDEEHVVDEEEEDNDEDWDDVDEKKVDMSFACEECDYRWEDTIIKRKDELDYDEDISTTCPMCGSTNITQI